MTRNLQILAATVFVAVLAFSAFAFLDLGRRLSLESDRRESMSLCKYGQKAPGGSYGCSCGFHEVKR